MAGLLTFWTKAAIGEMIVPSLLPVVAPVALFLIVYKVTGSYEPAFTCLGAMLLGTIVTGYFRGAVHDRRWRGMG